MKKVLSSYSKQANNIYVSAKIFYVIEMANKEQTMAF